MKQTLIIMYKKIILVVLIFASCKSKNEEQILNKEIINCIEVRSKEYTENLFNINDIYVKIEKMLIEKKILSNKDKEGYKKLFTDLFNSKNDKKRYIELYSEIINNIKYSEMLLYPGFLDLPFECNLLILKKNKLNEVDFYSNYYKSLVDVFKVMGPGNDQLYLDLIKNTPNSSMSNIIYRAPLLVVVLGSLEYLSRG